MTTYYKDNNYKSMVMTAAVKHSLDMLKIDIQYKAQKTITYAELIDTLVKCYKDNNA